MMPCRYDCGGLDLMEKEGNPGSAAARVERGGRPRFYAHFMLTAAGPFSYCPAPFLPGLLPPRGKDNRAPL